jgi:phosphoglycolate phosphatase
MNYKLVIFDLDGTLLDTLDDLSAAVNHAMQLRGFPQHTRDEYMKMVGHGARNLMRQALPTDQKDNETLIDAVLADFRAYYTAHIDMHTKPFPGIQNLLTKLHQEGVLLAVASNKFQEGTEHLIKEFFPEIPFVAILGNRPNFPLKPDAEVIGEVLRKTGVKKEEAVMVGDSDTDMETAANGGIEGIAVSWGYRDLKDLADKLSALRPFDEPQGPQAQGPRFITVVDSADELQKILLP